MHPKLFFQIFSKRIQGLAKKSNEGVYIIIEATHKLSVISIIKHSSTPTVFENLPINTYKQKKDPSSISNKKPVHKKQQALDFHAIFCYKIFKTGIKNTFLHQ